MSNPAEDIKFTAEAEAARALAAFHAANARKADAEARRADAEAEAFQVEIDGRQAQTDVARITADSMRREEQKYLASDSQNGIYRFSGSVSDESVKRAMDTITAWSRLHPAAPLEIQFYSPGGSVLAGLALWDFLQEIKSRGHHITTVIRGVAASMAGILSQAGDTRVIGKESWLMIHEVSFGAQGKVGEVEDTTEWVKMVQKRVLDIFASRSNLSVKQLETLWKRKDAWISSADALAKGFVDEVR